MGLAGALLVGNEDTPLAQESGAQCVATVELSGLLTLGETLSVGSDDVDNAIREGVHHARTCDRDVLAHDDRAASQSYGRNA